MGKSDEDTGKFHSKFESERVRKNEHCEGELKRKIVKHNHVSAVPSSIPTRGHVVFFTVLAAACAALLIVVVLMTNKVLKLEESQTTFGYEVLTLQEKYLSLSTKLEEMQIGRTTPGIDFMLAEKKMEEILNKVRFNTTTLISILLLSCIVSRIAAAYRYLRFKSCTSFSYLIFG